MDALAEVFEERLGEIETYLDFLASLEREAGSGAGPRVGASPITTTQQRILYASVFLQLYNLVEATAIWCANAVCRAVVSPRQLLPGDLSSDLRREWVRNTARTHKNLPQPRRLDAAVAMCDILVGGNPIVRLEIEKGHSGNWDDHAIEDLAGRIGLELAISESAHSGVRRRIRDDKGSLELVKDLRNRLAHGDLSFAECSDMTVSDLADLKERIASYLREVVKAFESYISGHQFLVPPKRPAARANS